MANKLHNSLFIIGAGAHVPYQMPTGACLRNHLKQLYTADSKTIDTGLFPYKKMKAEICDLAYNLALLQQIEVIVSNHKYPMGAFLPSQLPQQITQQEVNLWLNRFLESFCDSHVTSIDTYLSQMTKESDLYTRLAFSSFGKLLIAYLIHYNEMLTPLGARSDDWIHSIINNFIKKDADRFFRNPPKIITFNYDRILERMIYTHLREFHKKESQEAKELIDKLSITHVYGMVGDYQTWEIHNSDKLTYFANATNNIRVIGEERTDLEDVKKDIRQKYNETEHIYFLGYGYDEQNNELLRSSFSRQDWYKYSRSYSTSINLKIPDLRRIMDTLGNVGMIRRNNINNIIEQVTCDELINQIAPLELI